MTQYINGKHKINPALQHINMSGLQEAGKHYFPRTSRHLPRSLLVLNSDVVYM